jgi:tetratricopeptide (TPR) repeat protein
MSLAAKHRKQAAEYEKQQDFERALTAYTAAIQESDQAREEVDVALFNKVGDLALRLGRLPEAMAHYERAVDQYAASGRYNNAIALCNKIKRTTPGRTGIYLTLGRICARKGLRGDASSNFLEYATRMQQEGRTGESRRALEEAAALFPDIPELRRLVAELGEGATGGGGAAAPAARPVPPSPPPPASPASMSGGGLVFLDVDAPVAPLSDQEMREARVPTPISSPVIPDRPVQPVRESIGASLEDHLLFDPMADAREGRSPSAAPAFDGRAHLGHETDSAAGPPSEGPGLGAPTVEPPVDRRVTGGDSFGSGAASDDGGAWELPPLVIPLEGMEPEGRELADPVPALEALMVEETLADALEVLRAAPPVTVQIPTPRDIAIPGMVQAIAEGERLVASAESQSVLSVLVAVEAAMAPPPPFRVNPHDFILPGELPPLVLDDAAVDRARARDVDMGRAAVEGMALIEPQGGPPEATSLEEADLEEADLEEADLEERASDGRPSEPRKDETGPVGDGEEDGGVAALDRAIDAWCAAEDWSAAAAAVERLVAMVPDRLSAHQRRVEIALHLEGRAPLREAYLGLAAALTRRGDAVAAKAVHARVQALSPDAAPAREAPAGEGDEALGAAKGTAARIRVTEPDATGDDAVDFEAVLRLFKDGVARTLGEEDAGSRYDLGVAYKEMGLLDDAVAEFRKALRSPAYRLPAYEALGQCFVEQGRHQVAITLLSRALPELPSVGQDDRQHVGMRYLLAYANEALQRRDEARIHYQRVFQIDSSFRDVAARMAALSRGPS